MCLKRRDLFSCVFHVWKREKTSPTENIDSPEFKSLQKEETFSKVKLSGSFRRTE